jgi:hypothetical protein
MRRGRYLDVEILVNFHNLAKGEDELHDAGKLPHIAYFVKEEACLLGRLRGFHLFPATLSRRHQGVLPKGCRQREFQGQLNVPVRKMMERIERFQRSSFKVSGVKTLRRLQNEL